MGVGGGGWGVGAVYWLELHVHVKCLKIRLTTNRLSNTDTKSWL